MFILFNKKLINTQTIKSISRIVHPDETKLKPFGITIEGTDEFEWFDNETSMNRRFNQISESIGCTSERGF